MRSGVLRKIHDSFSRRIGSGPVSGRIIVDVNVSVAVHSTQDRERSRERDAKGKERLQSDSQIGDANANREDVATSSKVQPCDVHVRIH